MAFSCNMYTVASFKSKLYFQEPIFRGRAHAQVFHSFFLSCWRPDDLLRNVWKCPAVVRKPINGNPGLKVNRILYSKLKDKQIEQKSSANKEITEIKILHNPALA